ncbi:transglycosylase domain-containing protein [Jeotgalibacillus proteolyticus]|uniref:Penicillin-binding protein n=1 Tax=Jeotgalibacillus proteolyticus TaxID=2082395 RepID=A0A2S5GAH3_9BACL|nr:transglycosylase domain-containing protein [Jeotgalibacillus proteolyticus]PPA69998.1 penicillin-binding protein [Jeotgalibacillus proteolyticus]
MRMTLGYAVIALLLPLCIIIWVLANQEFKSITSINEALAATVEDKQAFPKETSFLLDKDGNRFSKASYELRFHAESEEIPDFLRDIIVLSEDRNFYDHIGFDAGAIIRAVVKNLVFTHIQQGGSTITQQLARNLYLSQEKTYSRKITELVYAYEIEQSMTKEEILDSYLNNIYFNNGVYGIRSASLYYFKREPSELSNAEIAFLSAIPNNPGKYDPIDHFEETKKRQERLLDLMTEEKKLTETEAEQVKAEKIVLDVFQDKDDHPDYAAYVEFELKDLIALQEGYMEKLLESESEEEKEKLQHSLTKRTQEILTSGVIIHTALDPALQVKNTEALKSRLPYEGINGASVMIRNSTREIVSIVGGKDYQKYNFNRAFQAYRQPGSAIKPLLVFAPYIEHFSPELSQPIDARDFCINDYCPKNYGGLQYGEVSLSKSFVLSLNTPAVRLLEHTGIEDAFKTLTPFSFDRVVKEDYTAAAAVGGFTYGMSPFELTDAYTSFIDGSYKRSHAIQKVTASDGSLLYEWPDDSMSIWSPGTTDKMRQLLSAAATSGTGIPANVNKPYSGIKTGTTNQFFDFWTIGLTNEFTAGVWVGHDLPKSMESIEQDRPSQLIWRDMMK